MLEFKKRVLQKVSFDLLLFEKELMKATKWLMDEELIELKTWCYDTFGDRYKDVMDKCFTAQRMAS